MKMLLLFLVLQKFFSHNHKIITKYLVGTVLDNCVLLGHLTKVRRSCPDNIKTEIAFSLLEELLTLYIRTFIFVRVHFLLLQTKSRLSKSERPKQNEDLSEQVQKIYITYPSQLQLPPPFTNGPLPLPAFGNVIFLCVCFNHLHCFYQFYLCLVLVLGFSLFTRICRDASSTSEQILEKQRECQPAVQGKFLISLIL